MQDDAIFVDLLVLHPQSDVTEMGGEKLTITPKMLEVIVDKTNIALKNEFTGVYSKIKHYFKNDSYETYDFIPIQRDHSRSVKDTIGFTNGFFTIDTVDGNPYVKVKAKILKSQEEVKKGLYRKVSVGVADGVIKEISFVVSPANDEASKLSAPSINKEINNVPDRRMQQLNKIQTNYNNKYNLLKQKEKELYIENNLLSLLHQGKFYPRDLQDHRDTLKKMDLETCKGALNIIRLSQPVIQLGQIKTHNNKINETNLLMNNLDLKLSELENINNDFDFKLAKKLYENKNKNFENISANLSTPEIKINGLSVDDTKNIYQMLKEGQTKNVMSLLEKQLGENEINMQLSSPAKYNLEDDIKNLKLSLETMNDQMCKLTENITKGVKHMLGAKDDDDSMELSEPDNLEEDKKDKKKEKNIKSEDK